MLMAGIEDCNQPDFQFVQNGTQARTTGVEPGYLHHQQEKLPQEWVLLDDQSTVDVFSNHKLLRNIKTTTRTMMINCNAGVTHTNMIGKMPGYPGEFRYNPKGIANILLLANVKKDSRVTFDSDNGNGFIVHKGDGTQRCLKETQRGLFYLDTSETMHRGTVLVNTVQENKSNSIHRDCKQAEIARQLQDMIGRPLTRDYIKIVQMNLLPNCSITTKDIMAAEDIFGPNLGSLKGKTVTRQGEHVTTEHVDLPMIIMSRCRDIVLCIDIMFVNKIPFLMTISRCIKSGIAEMDAEETLKAINNIKSIYAKRGFRISKIHADNEFESLRTELLHDEKYPVDLNISANVEQEVYLDCQGISKVCLDHHAIQETSNNNDCRTHSLQCFLAQHLPPTYGISETLSPRAIIIGSKIDYNKHCSIEYGAYVQTHEEHDNSMATGNTGAIALIPTGNQQGGYYFTSVYRATPQPQPLDTTTNASGSHQPNIHPCQT